MPAAATAAASATLPGDPAAADSASCPDYAADLQALLKRIVGYLNGGGAGYDTEGREFDELRELWEAMGLLPRSAGGAAATGDSSSSSSSSDDYDDKAVAAAASSSKQEQEQEQEDGKPPAWYSQAFDYWEAEQNCPATVDGVLGGFGHVSPKDIAGSQAFVARLRVALPNLKLGRVVGTLVWVGVYVD